MNKSTFIQLLESPNDISEYDLEHLEEMVDTYPYCQLAHLLIAKFNQDHESIFAPQKVRRAAAYAFDRGILRKLLNNQLNEGHSGESTHIKTHVEQLDTQIEEDPVTISDEITQGPGVSESGPSFFDNLSSSKDNELNNTPTPTPSPETDLPDSSPIEEGPVAVNYPDEEINENLALSLFNEGKLDEAILVYKKLAELNPSERSYYYNQLSVLTGDESYKKLAEQEPTSFASEPETPPVASDSITEDSSNKNEASFFENINLDNGTLNDSDPFPASKPENENISEANALALYYEGKKQEAFAMYEKLMELYPEQKDEFQMHLNNLKRNSVDNADTSSQTTTTINNNENGDQSFFQGINSDNLTSPAEEPSQEAQDTPVQESPNAMQKTNSGIDEQMMKDARDNIAEKIQNPELIEEASAQAQTDLNDYTSESEAILLFNQGRSEEAIRIYEKLIEQNPQKASYYRSQINVLIEVQNTQSELTKTNPSLPIEEKEKPIINDIDLKEDLSERIAIQLFNQGKTEEAVEVYKKLIDKYPDKKTYFLSQIEILES